MFISPKWLYAAASIASSLLLLFPTPTSAQQRYPGAPKNMFSYRPQGRATAFIAFLISETDQSDADRHSPLYFRRRGGIGDVPEDLRGQPPYSDTEYGYETLSTRQGGTGPWVRLSLNLSSEVENLHGGYRSFIVYAVSTSPNMMPSSSTDRSEMSALGGVPWSQIRGWAYLNWDQWRMPDSLDWERNEEFDERWYAFGANVVQPLLSGNGERPDDLFRRHVAWHYLRFITEPSDPERHLLSQLLDWRPYARPRDFPLIRYGLHDEEGERQLALAEAGPSSSSSTCDGSRQPDSLQYSIINQFDYENLGPYVPEFVRHGMRTTSRPSDRMCNAALFYLRGLYFTTTKRDVPKSQPPSSSSSSSNADDIFNNTNLCKEQGDTSSCLRVADLVKGSCNSISSLTVDIHLGEKGTDEAIGLLIGGASTTTTTTTEAVIPLLPFSDTATPHRTVKDVRVDMKRVFGSDVVPLRDIDYIVLLDTPRLGSDPRDWTLGGITLTASCANLAQKMTMSSYSSVNEVVQNSSPSTNRQPETVWRRDLNREDWKIVA
ncbi:putative heat-labile enterotoxin [Ophiocordyceps camponoti-leonardi (nom. inval.)]|nr:putative heat-labile enterotoxin [Ophiocordyceps camponoti-leonardi (nom. inval.)]